MPEVAANATNALLANWLVEEGSAFQVGDPLAVIETEKAAVDFEAPSNGVLVKVLVANGQSVDVGAPIALIAEIGEQVLDVADALMRLGLGASDLESPAQETIATSPATIPGTVVSGTSAALQPTPSSPGRDSGRVFASPLARKLARTGGIPLNTLDGTGPGGRIVRRDVQAAMLLGGSATPARNPSAAAGGSAYVDVPHTRMRRAIAARLMQSTLTAPHFYLSGSCRVDALLELREAINEQATARVSINDFVIKAIARAHALVPDMNVIWTDKATRRFSSVDISVAIATEQGILTPVLRAVSTRSLTDIAASVQDFILRARTGQIEPQELDGGSVTVTNLGMYGVEEFSAIINPPQSSILAVGAATRQAVIVGDRLEIGSVMKVVLSVDHRPVDGATAARWMQEFVRLMENPILMLV